MKRLAWLFALVLSFAAPAPALAQELEPRNVRPVHVPSYVGGMRTLTWDGRIVVTVEGFGGWSLRVFRPENVRRDAAGRPDMSGDIRSDEYGLEKNGDPNSGMGEHNNLGLFPTPSSGLVNPFRSSASGDADPNGGYECYDVTVITTYYHAPSGKDETGMRRAKIVVRNPRTKDAAIERAWFLEPFQRLTTTAGQAVLGIEPTVSFDGRLIVFQGAPKNNGEIDHLMYSWNATPGVTTGWSVPRVISDLYHVDRDKMVDGIKFSERYPLAAQPLRTPDGKVFTAGAPFHGAYPWLSHDGTELFFCAAVAGREGIDRARRGASSVIGRWTGYMLRHIDGPVNQDRETSVRFSVQSAGAKPSFWMPFPDVPDVPFPYTAARPAFPVIGSSTDDVNDIDFEDFVDQDYVLALRMNEAITQSGEYDKTHTADTSGNFNYGTLAGARFPIEYDGKDEERGVVGQAIHFAETDKVVVKNAASLCTTKKLSVELWVKRTVNLDQDGDNRFRFVINKPGSWNVILEEDGSIQASVTVHRQDRRSGGVGPAIPLDEWVHVAFTYDSSDGTLRTYLRGEPVGQQTFGPGDVDVVNSDLIIGNGGQTSSAPFVGTRDAIFLIDDVKVSRVVRSEREIAKSAYRDLPRASYPTKINLPRGLSERDLRVNERPTNEAVELGKLIFFEKRISGDRTVSCATCHDPGKAFTDGRMTAQGIFGKTLRRNTPSVINRALSTRQFWDGRAGSLEEQAVIPIETPDEMGFSVDEAARFFEASPEYRDKFRRAFNAPANRETIGRALAAFQRTLLSGDSRADRDQLDDSERRGRDLFATKARCTACHQGSNFSDESFHATVQAGTRDGGREEVTARRHDRIRFKTPSLRDVNETGPYLHDGSARTLEDVVDTYDRGSVGAADRDPEIRPLGLSAQEKADLVAYLRSLTGQLPNVAPPTLPPDPPGYVPPPAPTPTPGNGGTPGAPPTNPGGMTDIVNGGFDNDLSGWNVVGGQYVAQEPVRKNGRRGIAHVHPRSKTEASWVEQEVALKDARAVRATVSCMRKDAGGKDSDVVMLVRVMDQSGAWSDVAQRTVRFDDGWVDLRADLSKFQGQRVTIRIECRAGGKKLWASEHGAVDRVVLEAP